MAQLLSHRGPDDSGVWLDPDAGVGLGHRRLSILDLSVAGRQPMVSASGRWVVSFNGELYNFRELRREMESAGVPFRGGSDTEVLVNALDHWGVEPTLRRLVGMFALAAWDTDEQSLLLARDRLGQKPLFFGFLGEEFVFGSELRVIRALEDRPSIDANSVALMLRYQAIPAPHAVYQGFGKLEPASYRTFSLRNWELSPGRFYWEPWQSGVVPRVKSLAEAKDGVRERLSEAVKARMISDVPLGAFLSGGIDSSLVVSYMCRHASAPVKTFTIGYHDLTFDEGRHAREVARHLGTEHTELRLAPADTLDVVPLLGQMYDEPFSDPSQLPTHLVARMTRRHVTVALSGEGGDEFFGGYNRHVWLPTMGPRILYWPRWFRRVLGRVLRMSKTRELADMATRWGLLRVRLPRDKIDKIARVLRAGSLDQMYRWLLSDWVNPRSVVAGVERDSVDEMARLTHPPGSLHRFTTADALLYLPEVILVKVDRATMACGLEARAPFLDHRLVEYSLTLAPSLKVRRWTGKYVLRELLKEHLPAKLFERPKMGFDVPIESWLRNELRDWAAGLIHSEHLGRLGLLRREPVLEAWKAHLSGRSNESNRLWSILCLLSWLEANR